MAKPHKQPTQEELQENIDKNIEAAEKDLAEKRKIDVPDLPPEETEESPEVKMTIPKQPIEEPEEEPVVPESEEATEDQLEEKPVEEEEKEKPPEEEEKLKKKLSASARENQKINAKNRVINKAIADAEEAPEPTEEEIIAEYPDWDVMSDTEKKMARETIVNRRFRETIKEARKQAEKIEKWNEDVDKFTEDPVTLNEYPDLEGKADEFKEYAKIEKNNNIPFDVLVPAFLHNKSKDTKPSKGKMFETDTGGREKGKPKGNKLTIEEGRRLRETNYDKWKDYLKRGLIESVVEIKTPS